jgi:hypothetical protein
MDQSLYANLMLRAVEGLRAKTSAHIGAWRLDEADWAVDQHAGTIVFNRSDGICATAAVQIIGTYNTADGTFLWGWDHPSVQPPLNAHAARVFEFGMENEIAALTTRKISCTEEEAWGYTALACELNDAQGAYRGPAGATLIFMTFGEVTLSKSAVAEAVDAIPERRPEELVAGLERVERPDVIEFLRAYFGEMFQIEKAYNDKTAQGSDDAMKCNALDDAIAAMRQVYTRTWRRDDEYWVPGSVGWPSDYDWERTSKWEVYQVSDDTLAVTYKIDCGWGSMSYAFTVKEFDGGLRIVDFHF